ncbi:type I-E CRISPR-associated protein Cas5/CasD [Kitasatospora sp. NPDC001119]
MSAYLPAPRPASGGRGLLLHLAGPLQSWGERSHFNERDTAPFPTRSGVIGLLASALGRERGADITDLVGLSLTVRVDRPGVLLRDLHTVGGGLPPGATVTTADGKKRPGASSTLLSHRYYLADAAFTAAVTGDPAVLAACADALDAPRWPPFLGRRSCPPEGPLLLGLFDDVTRQLIGLPIARRRPASAANVEVVFHGDRPLTFLSHGGGPGEDGAHPAGQVTDEPSTFHPRHRAYRARPRYQRTLTLPADRCAGLGTAYLTALGDHLDRSADRRRPESTRP